MFWYPPGLQAGPCGKAEIRWGRARVPDPDTEPGAAGTTKEPNRPCIRHWNVRLTFSLLDLDPFPGIEAGEERVDLGDGHGSDAVEQAGQLLDLAAVEPAHAQLREPAEGGLVVQDEAGERLAFHPDEFALLDPAAAQTAPRLTDAFGDLGVPCGLALESAAEEPGSVLLDVVGGAAQGEGGIDDVPEEARPAAGAEGHSGEFGRIPFGAAGADAGRHPRAVNVLEPVGLAVLDAAPRAGPRRIAPGPVARPGRGSGRDAVERGLPVEVPGEGEGHVPGRVSAGMVGAHLLRAEGTYGVRAAEHALPERMRAVEDAPDLVEGGELRLVLVARDLFEDDMALELEIIMAQGGHHEVAQQVEQGALELRQHVAVEDRRFLGGERVVLGAHLVELAVYVVGRAPGGPLEDHVFEEMADPRFSAGLVARAGPDEVAGSHGERRRVVLADHGEAAVQRRYEGVRSHALLPFPGTAARGTFGSGPSRTLVRGTARRRASTAPTSSGWTAR